MSYRAQSKEGTHAVTIIVDFVLLPEPTEKPFDSISEMVLLDTLATYFRNNSIENLNLTGNFNRTGTDEIEVETARPKKH